VTAAVTAAALVAIAVRGDDGGNVAITRSVDGGRAAAAHAPPGTPGLTGVGQLYLSIPVPGTTTGSPSYTTGGGRGAAGGWKLPPNPKPAADCPSMQVSSLQNASGIPPSYHGPLFVDAAPVTGCIAAARSLAGYGNVGGATDAAHPWGVLGQHPWGVNLVQDFNGGAWGANIIMQGCASAIDWTGACPNPYLPAFVVRTRIWETYRSHDGINQLGPPLGNEAPADGQGGAFQLFVGGMIVWSPKHGGAC